MGCLDGRSRRSGRRANPRRTHRIFTRPSLKPLQELRCHERLAHEGRQQQCRDVLTLARSLKNFSLETGKAVVLEDPRARAFTKQARHAKGEGKPGRDLATVLATEGRTPPRLALLRPDASGGGFRQMPGPDSFGPRGVHYGRTSDSTRTRQQSACCAAERRTILEEGARIPARSACT